MSRIEVLGNQKICGRVPQIPNGAWLTELNHRGIYFSDVENQNTEIELLIGSDYYAEWVTGNKVHLNNGLIALETTYGWTLSGSLHLEKGDECGNVAMLVTSLFVSDSTVSNLWKLETIGIRDSIQVKSQQEREFEVREQFEKSVTRVDGRYEVALPWTEGHPPDRMNNNREVALKRLQSTTTKLINQQRFEEYNTIFSDWLKEGFIETANDEELDSSYYLPHRAVYKPDSQTTPVRPVFDASCKCNGHPSLNDLLEKGPNLIELIPTIILNFRNKKVGISADIRKAFQMIEVNPQDRNYLRFLWWENKQQNETKVFRHKRVVFGVNSSPFLLAAVIETHLNRNVPIEMQDFAKMLLKSFYVDNCLTSVDNYEDYEMFKHQANSIMSDAKMELRNWEHTALPNVGENSHGLDSTKILGINWNKVMDTLCCLENIEQTEDQEISDNLTKRSVLSLISRIFDPVGMLCPAVLPMKLVHQEAWATNLSWDATLPVEQVTRIRKWQKELNDLSRVQIPRFLEENSNRELHTSVSFLRTITSEGNVKLTFVMAKSRVAPLKRITIPRMELLACVIGTRMAKYVIDEIHLSNQQSVIWSDSTTAIAWITRNNQWGTFVGNRVKEIRQLSDDMSWRHVPGVNNPADLPSRGCSPSQLAQSKWWEGPSWLYSEPEYWVSVDCNTDE